MLLNTNASKSSRIFSLLFFISAFLLVFGTSYTSAYAYENTKKSPFLLAVDPTDTPTPFPCPTDLIDCDTPTPTPTDTPTPLIFPTVTTTTNIEIASTSATSYVIYNMADLIWNIGLCISIYCGAKLGLWPFSL